MQCHKAKLDGNLFKRGFWFYICVITQNGKEVFYVGRTGDASSSNAGSPFLRLTSHLDLKVNAKGAAMLNQLRKNGFDPEKCSFELSAFGPLYAEQKIFDQHKPYRDILAAVERDVAKELRNRGYEVIGNHNSRTEPVPEVVSQILDHEDFLWKSRS